MKRVFIVGAFFGSVLVHTSIVSLTREYTGQIDSYFLWGSDLYSLSGTTTNGYVQKYNTTYPYAGGMVMGNPDPSIHGFTGFRSVEQQIAGPLI